VQNARALVQNGDFEQALTILRPLAPGHPDQTDVRVLVGLAAMAASERATEIHGKNALLHEAIAVVRAILINHSDLMRVHLELARAFFLKGEDGLSQKHFRKVLATKPQPAIIANIRRFLQAIRARRRWSGYFGFAVAPDTNVNSATDEGIIYIYGLPFRINEDSKAKSGIGVLLWGGGQYQHPLGERLWLDAGADLARREYGGKTFDQTFLAVHIGPRWLVGQRNTEVSLLASTRHRRVAGKAYSHDLGVRLEVRHRLTARLTTRGQASWHSRNYQENNTLDVPLIDVSLSASWLIKPTIQGDAAIGYERERPKLSVWNNSSRWARIGASFTLPLGFTLGGSGELHWTRYEAPYFTPGGADRKDRMRILRASVFNRAFTISGFSPQLVLVNEVRASHAQLQDYRRNRTELRFVRQF